MLVRFLMLIVLVVFVIGANAFAYPIPNKKTKSEYKPTYGVSYSFEQAGWYGLDARADFVKLLVEVNPDWVRLPFFWDQMVDSNGDLRIDDLKFAIEEANMRNIKVVIALGAKTPYYPETHFPAEISRQIKFGERLTPDHPVAAKLLDVDRKLVEELSKYSNISHWQVENEPLLGDPRGVSVSVDLVKKEVDVVRVADSARRPIIVNHPAGWYFDRKWQDLLSILEPGDVYSTNAYFKTKGSHLIATKILGIEVKIPWPEFLTWPVQSWPLFSPPYESFKVKAAEKGAHFWIMEMQAEPYIRETSDAQKNKFEFDASDIEKGNKFLKSFGVESIGLWGAHFWQFRQKNSDLSWVEAVKSVTD